MSSLSLRARVAALFGASALAAAALGGCMSSSSETTALAAGRSLDDTPQDPPGNTTAANDGGAWKGATYRGSPLCRIGEGSCLPDGDDKSTGLLCGDDADGGAPDGGATGQGCRVAEGTSGAPIPQCASVGDGADGASCQSGADCKAGFDCVEGERGGQCRRYCCLGSCKGQASQNGGATFCDVRKAMGSMLALPVCMPVKTCKLLSGGVCGDLETCAIVDSDGTAGCVPAGSARAGESCDAEHCAKGLTCVGSPGARRCLQLCEIDKPCIGGLECKSAAFINDPKIGVCTATP